MRKNILLSLLSFCLLPPCDMRGQAGQTQTMVEERTALVPEPATDHIKYAGCSVTYNKEFTKYGLHYSVQYSDGKPTYSLAVEENSTDEQSLWDQCEAFVKAMQIARLEEAIQQGKEEIARKRRDHFFLDAKKVAKR